MPQLAFVTIGQAPRDDVVPELLVLLGAEPGSVAAAQFGALDDLTAEDVPAPEPREARLYTRMRDGTHVVVGASFVARRLQPLLQRLDECGYDLIVLITTGVFQPVRMRTPFVHGQHAVDAWVAALVMGECALGLIYPLSQQHRPFAHGTLVQRAQAVAVTRDTDHLAEAALHLAGTDLILMHSVGYTEAMATRTAELTGKPVVTARRIIAVAMRMQLAALATRPALARPADPPGPAIDRLVERLDGMELLTPRERDVLVALFGGEANKAIGRSLGISHRTVEVHRSRVLAKLGAASPAELIRWVLISSGA